MRELHLIRHAKSSWGDVTQQDFDRPLNDRGLRDAPRMAQRLSETQSVCTDHSLRLISSPARRAWQTATIFARVLERPEASIQPQASIYEASTGELLALVNALDDNDSRVLMFGHNPGLSALATLLARCPFTEMPTCGIASIRFALDSWRDVVPASGRLQAYQYPKQST